MVKIEAEKYYRTRDGEKVGPMRRFDHETWQGNGCGISMGEYLWSDNGRRFYGDADHVIVSEWSDFDPNWPHGHVLGMVGRRGLCVLMRRGNGIKGGDLLSP